MDRRVSGGHLQAPDFRVAQSTIPAWHEPLVAQRLSLTTSAVAGYPGWLQPQRPHLRKRRTKESVLRPAAVLSRARRSSGRDKVMPAFTIAMTSDLFKC